MHTTGNKIPTKDFQLGDSEVAFQIRFTAHCPNLRENSLDSDIGYVQVSGTE